MNQPGFEIEEEEESKGPIWNQCWALEIFDQRISADELRLLLMLRARAAGRNNNYVSHKTLAEDLNVHEKTIAARVANLKKHGYLKCKSRGYGKPVFKIITHPDARYDEQIFYMPRKKIFAGDRSADLLQRLHNPDIANRQQPVIDNSKKIHQEPTDSHGSSQLTPMEVAIRLPEEDKEKEDKLEIDKIPECDALRTSSGYSGVVRDPNYTRNVKLESNGDLVDQDSGEVLNITSDLKNSHTTVVLPTPEIALREKNFDDRDARMAVIQANLAGVAAETDRKAKAAADRARAKREADEASGAAEE